MAAMEEYSIRRYYEIKHYGKCGKLERLNVKVAESKKSSEPLKKKLIV